MGVFLIGATTVGKNVGSISIYDDNNPKNTWGMQPIVVKFLNKDKAAEYGSGFTPDIVNLDNSLVLHPLGDEKEVLLSVALAHIAGISGRGERTPQRTPEMVGHSLDFNKRSNQLIVDWRCPDLKRN